jgi:hypothetical protein
MLERLSWPEREAMLFLQNRKRGLGLQLGKDGRKAAERGPHRVVFPPATDQENRRSSATGQRRRRNADT